MVLGTAMKLTVKIIQVGICQEIHKSTALSFSHISIQATKAEFHTKSFVDYLSTYLSSIVILLSLVNNMKYFGVDYFFWRYHIPS